MNEDDFTLNDMVDFFAQDKDIKVVVVDEEGAAVVEKEKKDMSEKLEEKYKYMCKLVEQMASSLESHQKANDKMSKEVFELKKKVSGAENKKEVLLDYIDNICGIIEAEMPLKEQDLWVNDCITQGFYKRDEE